MTSFKNHKILSLARTVNQNFEFDAHGLNAAHIIVDVTAGASSVNNITFHVEGFDEASSKWYTILSSASIQAVGTVVLKIFKGADPVANTVTNDFLPERFRVRTAHATAVAITYSVNINLKP